METQETTVEPTAEPIRAPGARFHTFWLNCLIGRGGIGEVWEITNKGKVEALKIIQAQWLGEENVTRRMVDEGRLLVRVKHPNVVEVHEQGITPDGQVWIRMERLFGETLREVLHRRGLFSLALACTFMRSAAHAAHQCHVIGAVHRDIKPENLFVTKPEEIVKLLDFGIAKLYGSPDTGDGQRHGTPLYMAPEQIRGQQVTAATDVYALGLVTYEVLCGAHPFVDDPRAYELYELYYKHFFEVPAPLTCMYIPQEVSDVVAKALEKDPKDRHQSGLEFAEALWGAWCVVRDHEPGWDTEPGEPTREELLERPEDGLTFGTGPSEGRRPSAPAEGRPSRVSRPSRISLVHRAVERAKTELLPKVPRDPEALVAFLVERASKVPPAPRAAPPEPPGQARNTSPGGTSARVYAPVAPSVRLAPVVDLGARPRFVPVQTTVPISVARADAAVPVRVELAAPVPVPEPSREVQPSFVAATGPLPPPPRADASRSGVHAPPVAPEAPPTAPRSGTQGWAEVADFDKAGVRPVPGINFRVVNPRLAGTFARAEPLGAVVRKAEASSGGRPLRFRTDHIFAAVALLSVGLAIVFFLVLHVTRGRAASTPEPVSDATTRPIALPSATVSPATSWAAPVLPPSPPVDAERTRPASIPTALPTHPPLAPLTNRPTASTSATALPPLPFDPELTRAASIPTALPTHPPQAPPTNTAKRPSPRRDVIDPWAR